MKFIVIFVTPEAYLKSYLQTNFSWEDMLFLEVSENVAMSSYRYLLVDLNIYHQRFLE